VRVLGHNFGVSDDHAQRVVSVTTTSTTLNMPYGDSDSGSWWELTIL
jgi:hypothetical protein